MPKKKQTSWGTKSFTHILIYDVTQAQTRASKNGTSSNKRDLVRTVFAAIEGLNWRLRQDVCSHAKLYANLSNHEEAALMEETYQVDEKGNVRGQQRFLPTATSIRLVSSIAERCLPNYKIDFSHLGWANLRMAVEVRNRIVHPKSMQDLEVTDEEIERCMSAFSWFLALAIEVRSKILEHMKSHIATVKRGRTTM